MSTELRYETARRLAFPILELPPMPKVGSSSADIKNAFYEILKDAGYPSSAEEFYKNLIELLSGNNFGQIEGSGSYIADSVEKFPEEGKSGIIYIDSSTNTPYYWNNYQYIELLPSEIDNHIKDDSIHFVKGNELDNKVTKLENVINKLPTNESVEKAIEEKLENTEKEIESLEKAQEEMQKQIDSSIERVDGFYKEFLEHIQNENIHMTENEKRALENILGLKYDPNGELLKFKYVEV